MSAKLQVKNWHQFQHYKDRNPSWIKLHKSTLDDYEFHRLPVASRALAPMLWLLASEDKEGALKYDFSEIGFRVHLTEVEVEDAITPLINGGFLTLVQDDSGLLADAEHRDSLEKRREQPRRRGQLRREREPLPAEAPPNKRTGDAKAAIEIYNRAASEVGWPHAQRLTAQRLTAITCRLSECGGVAGWLVSIDKAKTSPFLCGDNPSGWTADLDFLCKSKNFTKLMEGGYQPTSGTGKRKLTPNDALSRAVAEKFAIGNGLGGGQADNAAGVHDKTERAPGDNGGTVDLEQGDYRRTRG